jgi:hypothetical protein
MSLPILMAGGLKDQANKTSMIVEFATLPITRIVSERFAQVRFVGNASLRTPNSVLE